jgi:hypothetical protein
MACTRDWHFKTISSKSNETASTLVTKDASLEITYEELLHIDLNLFKQYIVVHI